MVLIRVVMGLVFAVQMLHPLFDGVVEDGVWRYVSSPAHIEWKADVFPALLSILPATNEREKLLIGLLVDTESDIIEEEGRASNNFEHTHELPEYRFTE